MRFTDYDTKASTYDINYETPECQAENEKIKDLLLAIPDGIENKRIIDER